MITASRLRPRHINKYIEIMDTYSGCTKRGTVIRASEKERKQEEDSLYSGEKTTPYKLKENNIVIYNTDIIKFLGK